MKPEEIRDLAQLLSAVPSLKPVDIKDVRRLAELLRENPEIGSIEVKGWLGSGVIITRTGASVGPLPMPMPMAPMLPAPVPAAAAAAAPASAPTAPAAAAAPPVALKEIKSPMVGTFYKAPEPGAEAYAKVGTRVSPGQTVCIIEAMKIMNEIEAEIGGVVREVLADDSQPVEFGQVLFLVDPNG